MIRLNVQVRAGITPQPVRQLKGRDNGGPTGWLHTLPDLDEQHLCERNRLP